MTADTLRAAADKLRTLVTFLGDNRGPWTIDVPESGYPQTINNVGVPYLVATTYEGPSIPAFTIAPYIATMHPGVGAAIADWLETEAATWASDEVHYQCSVQTCSLDAALAVARQILAQQ